jgi:hypothetical protein
MPYPFEGCFTCPECGNPLCLPVGRINEVYICNECHSVVHVHIWVDETTTDPSPVDKRHIC